jgi:hypothetical protein
VVEGALDADDPKAALVSLLVSRRLEVGAAGDMAAALSSGGEGAAAAVTGVLEHIAELLATLLAAASRKSRKALLELLGRVESACESTDARWGDGVAVCGEEDLERLGSLLAHASEIDDGDALDEAVAIVSELLDCMEQCGSAALQAVSALQSALGGSVDDAALVGAFEMLRCLSAEHQASVSSKEVMAAELIMGCLGSEAPGANMHYQLRESGSMALFALGCRNGLALCGTLEFVTAVCAMSIVGFETLLKVLKTASPDSVVLEELVALSAATACGTALGD